MNDDNDDTVPTQSPIQPTESPTSQSPTPNDNDIPGEEGDDGEEDGEEGGEDDDDGRMTFSVSHILLYEEWECMYHMCIILCILRLYPPHTYLPRSLHIIHDIYKPNSHLG